MSRRHSDAPINLIARIPSPEQLSAVRPKQRSFGQVVMESGAAWVRGIAELGVQLGRVGRSAVSFLRERVPGGRSLVQIGEPAAVATATETATGNARLGSTITPVQPAEAGVKPFSVQVARPEAVAVDSVSLSDMLALRSELAAHQQEVARLSAQVQELKSLVGSQQQVLVYLGQELEAQQMPMAMAAALASPPAKKSRVARAKSVAKEPSVSRTISREPSLNL